MFHLGEGYEILHCVVMALIIVSCMPKIRPYFPLYIHHNENVPPRATLSYVINPGVLLPPTFPGVPRKRLVKWHLHLVINIVVVAVRVKIDIQPSHTHTILALRCSYLHKFIRSVVFIYLWSEPEGGTRSIRP